MNPYASYDSSSRPFLYNGELPEGIEPLARRGGGGGRGLEPRAHP